MNDANGYARRYHWLSTTVDDFVCEPHAAVCAEQRGQLVLNLVAEESDEARRSSAVLAAEPLDRLVRELRRAQELELPARHHLIAADIRPQSFERTLAKIHDSAPADFEALLATPGVGPKTVRALALLADLLYGAKASVRDPASFSFAHGGKDGIPFPVDRETYDQSIEILRQAVDRAKINDRDKLAALRRLARRGRPR
jgi:hypothetical protein